MTRTEINHVHYIHAVGLDGKLHPTTDVVGTVAGEGKYHRVVFTGPIHYGKIFFVNKASYERWSESDELNSVV